MIANLSLLPLLAVFLVAAAVVVAASIKATGLADVIADRTKMGEALVGGLILGGATSLAGVVVSVDAALNGNASNISALQNAISGNSALNGWLSENSIDLSDVVALSNNQDGSVTIYTND